MIQKSTLILLCSLFLMEAVYSQKSRRKSRSLRDRTEDVSLKAETAMIDGEKELILENYEKAFELFKVAQELDPTNAAVNFKLSEVRMRQGRPSEAIAYSEKARELDPSNKFYYIQNAEVAQSLGRIEEASEIYEKMIGRISGTEQYLFDLAVLYQYQNRFDEALDTYERAESYYGISESVLLEKQKIYLKKGDLESLIIAWEQLIERDPQEYRYFFKLVEILINNGRLEDAKERLLVFREDEPENAEADLFLANIERKSGNAVKSLELLSGPVRSSEITIGEKLKLLSSFLSQMEEPGVSDQLQRLTSTLTEVHPDSYQALAFAGDVLYQLGRKQEAVNNYLEAITLSPGNFSVWQNTINLEFQLEQYDSVIVHSERALEYFPNQAIFYFFSGVGHYVQNDYKQSVRSLEAGMKFTTDKSLLSEFYGQLGDAYNGLEEYENSFDAYEKALANNGSNDHVLNNYSYFLSLRSERMDKALIMSEQLVRMHPNNPTYLDTYGWVLYVSGEYKDAKKYLKKAADLKPEDGTILEHYGDVLFRLGEVEEAVKYWEMASRTDEASDNIQEKIRDRQIYE